MELLRASDAECDSPHRWSAGRRGIVMLDLSDPRGRSRLYAALALVLGPLLWAVAALIDPAFSDGPGTGPGYVDQVASSPALHQTAGLLDLVGSLLLIVGLVGVIRLLRGPRGGVGRIGAGLLAIAVVVLEASVFSTSILEAAAYAPGSPRPQALALQAASTSSGFTLV